jgi:hypothetical protein
MKEVKSENVCVAVKVFLVNTLESASALIAKALKIIRSALTVIQNMVFRK